MAEDDLSVIIAILKPRVRAKSSEGLLKFSPTPLVIKRTKQKRLRKPSKNALERYCLPDDKSTQPSKVDYIRKEQILLPYRMYTKKQESDKHKQRLGINIYEKYKIITTGLQMRLHVEEPPDEVRAINEIDKGFFNYVNGRPLKDRSPLYKSLKVAIADLQRVKCEVGYRNDNILNIDINHKHELQTFENSAKRCKEQAKYFDDFISEDYGKSMALLNKWDQLKCRLAEKITELHNLASEQFTITSRLMGLDYLYGLQQKYGRFLYYLSPPSWRSKNREFAHSIEIEAKGFDLGHSNEEETFKVVFEKMKKDCLGNPVKPVLYFSQPNDLIEIFNGIEMQQLNHFSYVTHLAPPKKMLKEGIKCIKEIMTHESALVYNTIVGFEKVLEFSNERCTQLKNSFFSILNGLFYESVGSREVLKLFVHLEFCYERVYAEKPINMDIVSMAKFLESMYMDYSKQLDEIQSSTMKSAITKYVNEERNKFKTAKLAARELRLFNRLEKELLRSHKPTADRFKPFVQPFSKKIPPSKIVKRETTNVKHKEQEPLNESEKEYLTLFTDWIEGEDSNQYLHRLGDNNK